MQKTQQGKKSKRSLFFLLFSFPLPPAISMNIILRYCFTFSFKAYVVWLRLMVIFSDLHAALAIKKIKYDYNPLHYKTSLGEFSGLKPVILSLQLLY